MENMCFWQIVSIILSLILIVGCVILAEAALVIKEQTGWIKDMYDDYMELAEAYKNKVGEDYDSGNN